LTALEELRRHEDTARIPVILVTSRITPDEVAEGLRRGAYDYLRKPFEPAELLARVRAAERTRDLYDELRARNAELQTLVRTDPLTGTSNRRHLEEHLNMVGSSARRIRTTFCLLMIDIDRFKRINDQYGRTSGDEVLRAVAKRTTSALRGEDTVGRWGGEEFLVVLPHTPLDGGWHLAERIRQVVSDSPVMLEDGRDVVVTVSVGCSEGYGDDIEEHIRRVDAALSEAKEAGRNRVVADTTVVAT
jgi:diguanylate cyclase (GGDEF)-like protein